MGSLISLCIALLHVESPPVALVSQDVPIVLLLASSENPDREHECISPIDSASHVPYPAACAVTERKAKARARTAIENNMVYYYTWPAG